jgi:hypothetical protein
MSASTGGETITLKYPAENGLTTLTIRRPKVRDMLASDKKAGSDAEKEITLFANLCEVTPSDIELMDMADYAQLQEAYKNFLA